MTLEQAREYVNSLTHFGMFLAGIGGLVLLILRSGTDVSKLLAAIVFGVSIILLYGFSALYHWVQTTPQRQMLLRKLDHTSIFLLIAGTYTPVLSQGLEGPWKWSMLSAVWLISLVGIMLKLWFIKMPRALSAGIYVGLGWLAVIPFTQLVHSLPLMAIVLLLAGGLAYTFGGVVYATKMFNFLPNRFGFHEVFHLLVMAGTLFHFFMVYLYILPA